MFFMSEGVLSFSAWFSLYPSAARDIKTRWHWVLLVLTMVSAYSGLAAITYNKIINNKHHYVSWHGFSGIIVCGTLALQGQWGACSDVPVHPSFRYSQSDSQASPRLLWYCNVFWCHADTGFGIVYKMVFRQCCQSLPLVGMLCLSRGNVLCGFLSVCEKPCCADVHKILKNAQITIFYFSTLIFSRFCLHFDCLSYF